MKPFHVGQWFSKYGLHNISITWELARNVHPWVPPQTYWASHQKPWLSLARYAFILTTLPRDSWLCYALIGPVVEGELVSIICGCNINKKTSPELNGLIQQHSYLADSFVGLMGGASGLGFSAFLCWSCSHFCDQQVVLWLYYSAVNW